MIIFSYSTFTLETLIKAKLTSKNRSDFYFQALFFYSILILKN